MEILRTLHSRDEMKHRALTLLKVLRGLICLLVLVSTAFIVLIYFGFPSAVILRLFSLKHSRKATSFVFGSWLALWPFLFEKINKTKVVFSGENVPPKERVLLIANHRTEVDWMYLWDLALRKGCLGCIRYVLKSTLMKIPVFGWAFHILEFISVERKWEVDEPKMRKMLSTFKDPREPLWLALFPEGTDFTEQKCIRSNKFAAEKGLPILKNVLLPKTKCFSASLEELSHSLDAVYDMTIGYNPRCPTFLDNIFGTDPFEVHIHIQRFELEDIPTSEAENAAWLINRFDRKDQMLSNFYSRGHFPNEGTEGNISTIKCLVNFTSVTFLTVAFTYFTLFMSIWFKIYVSLTCAYLATATYFDVRPVKLVSSSEHRAFNYSIVKILRVV